jgi:hypothetical protein
MGFEPTIPASEQRKTYALHGPATGFGLCMPPGRSRVRFSMVSLEFIRDLYRCIIDLKKLYQSRTNILKDENSDLFTDSHGILNRRKNHFFQLFNVHGVSDVRRTEILTAEPLVPEPSALEVEMAIEKL